MKTSVLSLLASLSLAGIANADVVIRPAFGGTSISADTAADSATPAWTSLESIEIAELGSARGDISNGTLILRVPNGYELNTSVVPNIRLASTSNKDVISASLVIVDSQTILISLVAVGSNYVDRITIGSNPTLQVRPLSGTILTNALHLYRPVDGGTAVIAGVVPSVDGTSGTSFGDLGIIGGFVTQIGFTTQPGSAEVGLPFGQQPAIHAKDQYGNNSSVGLPDSVQIVTELHSGTGTLLGTVTNDIGALAGNGVISHSDLQINTVGDKQLVATAAGFSSVTSDVFTVAKGNPVITVSAGAAQTYGNAPFGVSAVSSSGLPVSLAVTSGPGALDQGNVSISGAGDIVLSGSDAGDENWNAASTNVVVAVAKADLKATAANAMRELGAANPSFTGTLTGVVNGDQISASYDSLADAQSPLGTYPITPTLVDPDSRLGNYNVTLVNGTLTVVPNAPALKIALSNALPVLSISGMVSHSYTVQSSATVDGTWSDLTTVTTDAAGLIDYVDQDAAAESKFYRLVVE